MNETLEIGLIVNPIAGMGGRVGLKGTDGDKTLRLAVERGAIPLSESRAVACLKEVATRKDSFVLYAGAGCMGESAARKAGLEPVVLGCSSGVTSAEDTVSLAQRMRDLDLSLIVFAGGDGTARDVCRAVGEGVLVLGIPAGVKIHSAVFASSPTQAGRLLSTFLSEKRTRRSERTAEVMDIDEDAYRKGVLKARLYGYMRMPYERSRVQGLKSGSPASDAEDQASIAAMAFELIEAEPQTLWLIGAGTTTRAVLFELKVEGTLLGVDALLEGRLLAADLGEREILNLLDEHPSAKIVITPIGGQGFLFGRGNQQFSPEVIRRVGRENLVILSSPSKIRALEGAPLLLDTGDSELDRELEGYYRIVTSYGQYLVYRAKQS